MTVHRNSEDPQGFWRDAEAAAREVAEWPAWKLGSLGPASDLGREDPDREQAVCGAPTEADSRRG
jgi:hypothetical protein